MKTIKIISIVGVTALIAGSSFAGILTTSTSAPTANVLDSNAAGGIDSAIIDEASNANHARGNLFSLADGTGTGYEITAVTIQKSGTQAYINDTLTLRIFEGTQAQWDSGSGHSTGTDGNDYYVDTTVTSLNSGEDFNVNGSFTDNHYVTFTLATPLVVNENSDFGFFMTYTQVDGTQDRFRYREGSSGGRISITDSSHATSSREMEYYVQGTVIPEPATLGLVAMFGGAVLFFRRRFMI